MKKIKVTPEQLLNIAVVALGVLGTILSSKVDENNRKAMKAEIIDEVKKEIQS